jgi:hypothetical protein
MFLCVVSFVLIVMSLPTSAPSPRGEPLGLTSGRPSTPPAGRRLRGSSLA